MPERTQLPNGLMILLGNSHLYWLSYPKIANRLVTAFVLVYVCVSECCLYVHGAGLEAKEEPLMGYMCMYEAAIEEILYLFTDWLMVRERVW